MIPKGKVKLERALSKLGFASRTQARELIENGKVSVQGRICRDPMRLVSPERDRIAVAGKLLKKTSRVVWMLHKPRGVVTTRSDERGRETVFSCLPPEAPRGLHAVGRLDLATTGLLLFTNDTRFSAYLTDPENSIPRVYLVTVRGELGADALAKLVSGVSDEAGELAAARVDVRKMSRTESHLVVELREGKNREIRRMFEAVGHEVKNLKRVSFGGLELGELAPGKARELSENELHAAFPGFRPDL